MGSKEVFLSADIGGTNTRLRLYELEVTDNFLTASLNTLKSLPGREIFSKKYENSDFGSLIEVLHVFLKESGNTHTPATACLAVAGPVNNQVATLTNRAHWRIDGKEISAAMGIPSIRVINDFVAMGYGILTLDEEKECVVLQSAPARPGAPIACIGAGTGLGECYLTPNGHGSFDCYASEGGHAEFAPRNELELGLLHYLKKKFESAHRISVERVVSGTGLANVYEFLSVEHPEWIDAKLHEQIESASDNDRGKLIAMSASSNAACAQAMKIFTGAYGSEAGVAMLKWLPHGGLYLTGGLTPKNIDYITGKAPNSEGLFKHAMLDKGRVSPMLTSIPVYAVMVENLGERGAQYTALSLLQEQHQQQHQLPNLSSITAHGSRAVGAGIQSRGLEREEEEEEERMGGTLVAPVATAPLLSTAALMLATALLSGALALANHHWLHKLFRQ